METKNHTGKEVLIVDDELDICLLLSEMLKKKELHTEFATSLRAAQKVISSHLPEILFIDNHLPDGYGVDLIPLIKRKSPNTKIVMITAHDNISDRERAFRNGVDRFIGKPFSGEVINRTIDELIQPGTSLLPQHVD